MRFFQVIQVCFPAPRAQSPACYPSHLVLRVELDYSLSSFPRGRLAVGGPELVQAFFGEELLSLC